MVKHLPYEAFIRLLELFYIGKVQTSDINAKAANQSIKYNAFYISNWQCNQKAQIEVFLILLR